MIDLRQKGIRSLFTVCASIAIVLWFLVAVVIAVEVLGLMNYTQVNYVLYVLGLALALVFRSNTPRSREARGPSRFHWVILIQKANLDTLAVAVVMLTIIWATKDKAISRQFVAVFLLTAWGLMILLNRFLPPLLAFYAFRGKHVLNTLWIGDPAVLQKSGDWLLEQRQLGMCLIGYLEIPGAGDAASSFAEANMPEKLGAVERLEALLESRDIQQIILADTGSPYAGSDQIINTCLKYGVRLLILTHWESYFSQPVRAVTEGNLTFFTLGEEPLQDPVNRVLKRIMDIVIALPVVIGILPLLALLVYIVQRWQAPGPLIYRQDRGGFHGQAFPVLKFRTMYSHKDTEKRADEGRQATRGDPRIYPFGHFLRRTSLDEFPQFINVLRGNMSVVGPRPHLIAHDREFSRYAELYRNRHFAKPGITGMAQHLGFRGEVSKPEDIQNRVRLDLEYIQNWSFWLDLGIVFKTAWHMVFPPATAV